MQVKKLMECMRIRRCYLVFKYFMYYMLSLLIGQCHIWGTFCDSSCFRCFMCSDKSK